MPQIRNRVHIVDNDLRAQQIRAHTGQPGSAVLVDQAGEVFRQVGRGELRQVLIDDDVAGFAELVTRLSAHAEVYAVCETIDLDVLGPAMDGCLRGIVARGDEDTISSDARPDPWRDTWRRRHAGSIVGSDPHLLAALDAVRACADTDATVLIHGENGTGKELVAHALHAASSRASGRFIALNCAALPEQLVEAELFGHTRGAFTGAVAPRTGLIQAAEGGTLFLDEIGDMPLSVQSKLLRVIQEREITPLGSDRPIPVNVRIVAATHQPLEQMVRTGKFRMDLYFRLSVIAVELPSLRDRRADLLGLAAHVLRAANKRHGRSATRLDRTAVRTLLNHDWPGNIRELVNCIERAAILHAGGAIRGSSMRLMPKLADGTPPRGTPIEAPATASTSLNLREAIDSLEKQLIDLALERANGNRTEAASLLGLNRTTLVEKLRRMG